MGYLCCIEFFHCFDLNLEKEEKPAGSPEQQSQEGLSALPANAATSINSSLLNCCVIRKMGEEQSGK